MLNEYVDDIFGMGARDPRPQIVRMRASNNNTEILVANAPKKKPQGPQF